jgi:Spy/CpxP family protein refolding chaperone
MRTNTSSSVTPALPPRPPRRRGLWILGPVLAALALGGASISAAHAQAREQEQEQAQEQAMDPTDAGAMAGGFMARRMERLLDKVGATASQRSQIEGIWNGLRPQLKALHQQHGAVRRQIVGALTAATISPPAVEQLRQQSMGLAEKTSALLTQGFVQTAQVLTPDQRKQVQSILAQERGRFHHGHGPEQP